MIDYPLVMIMLKEIKITWIHELHSTQSFLYYGYFWQNEKLWQQ